MKQSVKNKLQSVKLAYENAKTFDSKDLERMGV
jgi:hypothetical protein